MEIAHNVEDAMTEVRTSGEMSYRNTNSSFRNKGGSRIVSQMEPFIKGKGILQMASSSRHNTTKEGNGTNDESLKRKRKLSRGNEEQRIKKSSVP